MKHYLDHLSPLVYWPQPFKGGFTLLRDSLSMSLLLVIWIFCSTSFKAERNLISGETYHSAHDNEYFNLNHWIADLTFYFSPRSLSSQTRSYIMLSRKWLIGSWVHWTNFSREQTSEDCDLLCESLCVSEVLARHCPIFDCFYPKSGINARSLYLKHVFWDRSSWL